MPAPTFSADPRTRWITARDQPDRGMELIDDFWFDDRSGRRWTAPKGLVTDGASIPQALWTLVGSPFTGDYRRAALVHDQACKLAASAAERRSADRMFYEACRAGGCPVRDAVLLYLGVRIGAYFPGVAAWTTAVETVRPRMATSAGDDHVQRDFRCAADQTLSHPESDDPLEIEQRVDVALSYATGLDMAALDLRFG